MEAISEKLNGMAIQSSNPSTNSAHRSNVTPSCLNTVLVTANVGSVFEDTKRLMPIWLDQFDIFLDRMRPDFVAVHCQEVSSMNLCLYLSTRTKFSPDIEQKILTIHIYFVDRRKVCIGAK